ncbi:MAG: toll/interleukin-1 receptor domain-containing protein [Acidimicrobiia bacterium]
MWWLIGVVLVVVVIASAGLILGQRRRGRDGRWRSTRQRSTAPAGTPPPRSATPPASEEPSVINDPETAITAVYPEWVQPVVGNTLLVFAHQITSFRDEFGTERFPDEVIAELARREFDSTDELASTRVAALPELKRGVELTLSVEIDGAEVWPRSQTQPLEEPVQRAMFRFRFPQLPPDGRATGEVTAMVGPLTVAVVPIELQVALINAFVSARPKRSTAHVYQSIFASYSHRDTEIVEEIERAIAALGNPYLRDVAALRSGEEWDEQLLEMIDGADLFQLFWSSNSMRSPHVRREWEHALALNRQGFIRPIRWEDPMPTDLVAGLPPPALSKLHFHLYERAHDSRPVPPAAPLLPPPTSRDVSVPPPPPPPPPPAARLPPAPVQSAHPPPSLPHAGPRRSRRLVGVAAIALAVALAVLLVVIL